MDIGSGRLDYVEPNVSNKKCSILIITERFFPEEFGINEFATHLQAAGYKVSVLTQVPSYPFDKVFEGYKNKVFQRENWSGIRIYRIFTFLGYRKNVFRKVFSYLMFAFQATAVGLFFAYKYDSIYIYQVGPLTQAIPGVILKKIFRKNLFIWTLDVWPESVFAYGFKSSWLNRFLLNWLVHFVYSNCQAIFVSCQGFVDKIQSYAPKVPVIFTPQWAPGELKFENSKPQPDLQGHFNFTFAGNIGTVQNLENVILGFSLIEKKFPNARLNLIGDGSHINILKELVNKKNIQQVIFWGRKPLAEMPDWFCASDVLIISLTESPIFKLTVPAKFQAYLAAERAILCVMNGETARIVTREKIGLVAEPSNIQAISEAFERFINMRPEELMQYRCNMRNLLKNSYCKEAILEVKTARILGGFAT